MGKNSYLIARNKAVIYKLKRLYGGCINLYRQGDPVTDIKTGNTTWPGRQVITIKKSIILPVRIDRTQTRTISIISSDKAFVYGGLYDKALRWFYIDPRDLPKDYEIKSDDWITYEGKKYEIKSIKDNEFDSLWEILGSELVGVVPEQIHNLSAYNIVDFQQSAEVE